MDDDFNDAVEVGLAIVSEEEGMRVRQAKCGSHHQRVCANSIPQLFLLCARLARVTLDHHCEIVAWGSERVGP